MELSFSIETKQGDKIKVALYAFDTETVHKVVGERPLLTLTFYDVVLMRERGESYLGFSHLSQISHILANFLQENSDAVLFFYCDDITDVRRHHHSMLPQEYRSMLFSRMFDQYVQSHHLRGFVNRQIINNSNGFAQYAHFIGREEHLGEIDQVIDSLAK